MAALIRSTAPRVATGLAGKSNPPGPAAAIRFSARGQSGTDAVLVWVSDPTADPELGLARPSLGYQTPSIALPTCGQRRYTASGWGHAGGRPGVEGQSARAPASAWPTSPGKSPRPVRGGSARTYRSSWPPRTGLG